MIKDGRIHVTDGTSQTARTVAALQPGYFNLEEQGFEQLLGVAAEFAAHLKYYSIDDKVDGSWADLFAADEAVIMAMILSLNTAKLEAEFNKHSSGPILTSVTQIVELAKRFDHWLRKLAGSDQRGAAALSLKIENIVREKLGPELRWSMSVMQRENAGADLSDNVTFSRVWGIGKAPALVDSESSELSKSRLRSAFYKFINAVSYLKTITPIYLQQSLASQQHDPALGLYMAFLKLFEKVQENANSFTHRHLDFYYENILKARIQPQRPESVYLLLRPQAKAQHALIKKGMEFVAGKDSSLNAIVYQSDRDLLVRDARVTSVATLYLDDDPLVAPESDMNYATRAKVHHLDQASLEEAAAEKQPWPLFGEPKKTASKKGQSDAQIGFMLASPILLLAEGERDIEMRVSLTERKTPESCSLLDTLLDAQTESAFKESFGRLFSRYLMSGEAWLPSTAKTEIMDKADALLSSASAGEIKKLLSQDWQGLFFKLFRSTFNIALTTPDGWVAIDEYELNPRLDLEDDQCGFSIRLSLGHDVPAISPYQPDIHGASLDTDLAVLKCCINPNANFYPYSLFNGLVVSEIKLDCDVRGVKNIQLHNNHGQLDSSKPFHPFGPIPGNNSYIVFGNYELAQKKLTGLNLNIEWGELPEGSGGFEAHYQHYGYAYSNEAFKVRFTALVDGQWRPEEVDSPSLEALFGSVEDSCAVAKSQSIHVGVLDELKPSNAISTEEGFNYNLTTRAGFFRMDLTEPGAGFGHAEYPNLLTRVLSENARRKKQLPPPNPPYTPVINRITLDYQAQSTLRVSQSNAVQPRGHARLFHTHPFGETQVYPPVDDTPSFLLPQFDHQGSLYIGVSATELAGQLSLFFNLAEEQGDHSGSEPASLEWFYLAKDRWRVLPRSRMLSDSTAGFRSQGVVTLDLPADISPAVNAMPRGQFWVRATAKKVSKAFSSAYSIHTNAICVTKQLNTSNAQEAGVSRDTQWTVQSSVPGLGGIQHVGKAFGSRPVESKPNLQRRMSERLRHKDRATLPWDYERLVLQQFPSVSKAKCFPNMASDRPGPVPGQVLIVVVPAADADASTDCDNQMLSSIELIQIQKMLLARASSFVRFEVRNPSFERIQVRCTVKFIGGVSDGAYIKRLDQDISDYICPWKAQGYQAKFGWAIRQKEIESYIRDLDYVEFVTNFSMLHIAEKEADNYALFDTAAPPAQRDPLIRPLHPWSLAVPAKHHSIETIQRAESIQPEITGVNELELGRTFIISGSSDNGEKK